MRFTIFGGRGFIGAALAASLEAHGHDVVVPPRDVIVLDGDLGHVVYAIGLTADFRSRPLETIDAHVCGLHQRIRSNRFGSWLYLSSTRVYAGLEADPVDETMALRVRPDGDGIYNLSKLAGEALCLAIDHPAVRVARVANVFGGGAHDSSFLGMVLADIAAGREVVIGEDPASSKDYVAIEDVCWMLERIASGGRERLYNVASGRPTAHADIAARLRATARARIVFAQNGAVRRFPRISIARITDEFQAAPHALIDALAGLAESARTRPGPAACPAARSARRSVSKTEGPVDDD